MQRAFLRVSISDGKFHQGVEQGLGLAGLVFPAIGNMGRARLPNVGHRLLTTGGSSNSEDPMPGKMWPVPASGHLPEPWSTHQRWHSFHVACVYFGFLCASLFSLLGRNSSRAGPMPISPLSLSQIPPVLFLRPQWMYWIITQFLHRPPLSTTGSGDFLWTST